MTTELWNDQDGLFHPASAPDFLPIEQLRQLQLQRLKVVVQRNYDNVALFRQRMDERCLTPAAIQCLEDIAKLPFTVKTDLRDTYPFGMFASPMTEIVRLHSSSGTTGKPIVVAYTREDIEVWTSVIVRSFAACGLHRGDILQNAYGYGLFTGGLGAHYGAEALGATVIPVSGGNTDRQIMIMQDFGVTAICCTPSYFIHIIERAGELGVDMKSLPLRVGVFGAEPWSESMRQYIEENSKVTAFDIYGLSEIIGPGVAVECSEHNGLHIFEDHFYPEIIDPQTGAVLPEGAEGELVLTTLSKRAMPVMRYRTRDITTLTRVPCACGRTLCRFNRVGRRSDDMFIIRGVNVFPSQIEHALLQVEGTLPHYVIVLTRDKGLDQVEVQVEVTPELFSDTIGMLEGLQEKIVYAIEMVIGIRVSVRLVEPHSIQRSEGKAKRVIDLRKLSKEDPVKLQQISIFLENKPGQLKMACDKLAESSINMLTLSLADTKTFGILRIIVQDWQHAVDILRKAGFAVNVTEVLAVEVPDRPGGLADILGPLEAARLNVEYMYAFTFGHDDKAVMILRFNDIEAAIQALQTAGISMMESMEFYPRAETVMDVGIHF